VIAKLLLFLIRIYWWTLSPLIGSVCRFQPSFLRFTRVCIEGFGAGQGQVAGALGLLGPPALHLREDPGGQGGALDLHEAMAEDPEEGRVLQPQLRQVGQHPQGEALRTVLAQLVRHVLEVVAGKGRPRIGHAQGPWRQGTQCWR